jgi:hypothetical protein
MSPSLYDTQLRKFNPFNGLDGEEKVSRFSAGVHVPKTTRGVLWLLKGAFPKCDIVR